MTRARECFTCGGERTVIRSDGKRVDCEDCSGTGYECDYAYEIVCPNCGFLHTDSYDLADTLYSQYDGDEQIIQCVNCAEDLHVTLHVHYSYSTRKLEKGEE